MRSYPEELSTWQRHWGTQADRSVWRTSNRTAVKALELPRNYATELECYRRFKSAKVVKLHGFNVAEFMGNNDSLLILEMRIVTTPLILDFAKSYLDGPADYSEEQLTGMGKILPRAV